MAGEPSRSRDAGGAACVQCCAGRDDPVRAERHGVGGDHGRKTSLGCARRIDPGVRDAGDRRHQRLRAVEDRPRGIAARARSRTVPSGPASRAPLSPLRTQAPRRAVRPPAAGPARTWSSSASSTSSARAPASPSPPGQIADVAVHKGYAYLNSWDSPTCAGGGTFVVDIRNPAQPKQVAFIPALAPYYHGEGAHVISVDTPQFTGDLLAVNNETYGSNVAGAVLAGGPDRRRLRPLRRHEPGSPVPLVQGAGDRSPEGSTVQDPAIAANSYHSVFVWQDGPRAYLVASDNTELADVDIFDITDPTRSRVHQGPRSARPAGGRRDRRRVGLRQRDLPPRRRRQADRRPGADARVLLGRRLRPAQRHQPGQPDVHHRHGLRRSRSADRARPARGQRPPGRVLARQPVLPGRRRGVRAVPPHQPRSPRRRSRAWSFTAALSAAEPIAAGAAVAGDTVFVGRRMRRAPSRRRRPA